MGKKYNFHFGVLELFLAEIFGLKKNIRGRNRKRPPPKNVPKNPPPNSWNKNK
jgi:hypothetical protein